MSLTNRAPASTEHILPTTKYQVPGMRQATGDSDDTGWILNRK